MPWLAWGLQVHACVVVGHKLGRARREPPPCAPQEHSGTFSECVHQRVPEVNAALCMKHTIKVLVGNLVFAIFLARHFNQAILETRFCRRQECTRWSWCGHEDERKQKPRCRTPTKSRTNQIGTPMAHQARLNRLPSTLPQLYAPRNYAYQNCMHTVFPAQVLVVARETGCGASPRCTHMKRTRLC